MKRKHSDSLTTEEALVRLLFAGTGSVSKTAKSLRMQTDKARSILSEAKLVSGESESVVIQERRKQILTLFYQGKTRKQIAKATGVNIGYIYKVINSYQCLDRLEDISVVPHKPFPKTDEFQLFPIHRERLEALREAKVRKYYEALNKDETRKTDRK